MSSISVVNPQVTLPGSSTPVNAAQADKQGNQDSQAASASSASSGAAAGGRVAGPSLSGAAPAGGASSSSSDSSSAESDTVKQLKKQIADLQKQLAEEQRQLQSIQASKMDDESKAAAMGAIQSQVASTSASLQTAMGALTQALLAESGSASGSMVNTTA